VMEKKRSKGVTDCGWLGILLGVSVACFPLFIYLSVHRVYLIAKATTDVEPIPVGMLMNSDNLVQVLFGLGIFCSSIFLLRFKNWARLALMSMMVLLTVCKVLVMLFVHGGSWFTSSGAFIELVIFIYPIGTVLLFLWPSFVVSVILTLIYVVYLTRPKVKALFK